MNINSNININSNSNINMNMSIFILILIEILITHTSTTIGAAVGSLSRMRTGAATLRFGRTGDRTESRTRAHDRTVGNAPRTARCAVERSPPGRVQVGHRPTRYANTTRRSPRTYTK